ncbi:TPA: carbon starvation induced protein CsiD [Legionella anisa]|uniref:carbon starvation induced protein CsiD n=1 Tax=Legionella anisa TaxID=28082 RepID=UPI00197D1010|nr:carbon starvation induced protein CsiD [Legionella anisa]
MRRIEIDRELWGYFLKETDNFDPIILEKRPYSRFIIAHKLQEILGQSTVNMLVHTVQSHEFGGVFITYPYEEYDFSHHLRLATAVAYTLGVAYFDEMSQHYYAAINLGPNTQGDSFLSEPYHDLRLHTDGTFYKKPVEWVVLIKTKQHDVDGGELTLHHLNDLEALDTFLSHPLALAPFLFEASASKQLNARVQQAIFFEKNGMLGIRFSDQFCQPQSLEQALFLHHLSDCFEQSDARLVDFFPPGQVVILNNSCWLHGRLKIIPKLNFMRQLLRIRGAFTIEKEMECNKMI